MPKLYCHWTPDLQDAFIRAVEKFTHMRTAHFLGISDRALYDLRYGVTRNHGNNKAKRYFVKLALVERLAELLQEPELESREAISHSEMMTIVKGKKNVPAKA